MTTELAIPKNTELEQGVSDISAKAMTVTVTDSASYVAAADMRTLIHDMEKKVQDFFKPHKDAAHKLHKQLCASETAELDKLTPGLRHLDGELLKYDQEQDRIRRAEEERLRAIAQKEEEDRRLAEAAAAEAEGQHEEAAAIIEEPVYVPPVSLPKMTPQVAGVSYRENWTFEITDPLKVPREYLAIDETKIRRIVTAMKGATNIPGVRAYAQKSVAAGRRSA